MIVIAMEEERKKFPTRVDAFDGYREMTVEEILSDPGIEAVAVETEEIYLTKYSLMVAKAGKHLHMEKPGGLELDKFEKLIKKINLKDSDTIYILGDMFWCKDDEAIQVLDRLNGHKILVRGNHDSDSSKFTKVFDRVVDYLEIKDEGRHVVLCHYPIPCFKNHFYGWYHLYGHVHTSFEWNMMEHNKYLMEELYTKQCQMYNVGAMMSYVDYTPRTLDEIIGNNK